MICEKEMIPSVFSYGRAHVSLVGATGAMGSPHGKQVCERLAENLVPGRVRNAYEESGTSQRLYFLFGKRRKVSLQESSRIRTRVAGRASR
jgi:hypothetical protein